MQLQGHRLPGRPEPPVPLIVQSKGHPNNSGIRRCSGVAAPDLIALGRGQPATAGPGSGAYGAPLDAVGPPVRAVRKAIGSFSENRGAGRHKTRTFPLAPDTRIPLHVLRLRRRDVDLAAPRFSESGTTRLRRFSDFGDGRIRHFIDSQIPAYFAFLIHG